jgi:hypothetical protein
MPPVCTVNTHLRTHVLYNLYSVRTYEFEFLRMGYLGKGN